MPAKHSGKGKDSRRKRKMSHHGQSPEMPVFSPAKVYTKQAEPVMDITEDNSFTASPQAGGGSVLTGELKLIGIIGTVLVAVLIVLSIII